MIDLPLQSGEGWRIRYHVAPRYREGYGGGYVYDTEAEALARRGVLIGLGYAPVDVWATAHRWIVREAEPDRRASTITGSTSLLKSKRTKARKGAASD